MRTAGFQLSGDSIHSPNKYSLFKSAAYSRNLQVIRSFSAYVCCQI